MTEEDKVLLAHGGGGRLTRKLVEDILLAHLDNPILAKLEDSAVIESLKGRLAFTTDSFVVNPIFFPGGDIGKLSVHGTVNDLAMNGAQPLYLSLGLIIEEGLSIKDFIKIVKSIKIAAEEAKVQIVCGDTKVVESGSADKLFINTSGIGEIISQNTISPSQAKVGDKVILSGSIGDHGIAVLCQRKELNLKMSLESDCAPLNSLVAEMIKASDNIHCLRDPTRGGLATVLNEIAHQSQAGITIYEDSIPIKEEVKGACEILGFDPLYLANEGKLVAMVKQNDAEKILKVMKKNKYGKEANIIGEVVNENPGTVVLKTIIGSSRIVDTFSGEQLPRIC